MRRQMDRSEEINGQDDRSGGGAWYWPKNGEPSVVDNIAKILVEGNVTYMRRDEENKITQRKARNTSDGLEGNATHRFSREPSRQSPRATVLESQVTWLILGSVWAPC
ncbi:hypothetical protein Pcinc_031588 [Petrolisthes cinctipes]|uniref:Uncharacterized protein n=1 Tax=Petrolisthes cinctipes TaxID=88211 RepID=A0AAE1EWA9_PETCI|nr:hypothetical protein Pcinc_031588 [Petrolisthes cinctipes]